MPRRFSNDPVVTTLRDTGDMLEVRHTRWEKVAGLLRDVRVPLSAIDHIDVVPNGLTATRGLRAPGLAIPGRRKIGTWRGREGRQLISVRRGQPAVRVYLRGSGYDVLVIGSPDAEAVASRLVAAASRDQ
jgi:hypothetical protein